MLITRRINNNVAMAQDADGNELVVFGKALGFRKPPYEIEDDNAQIHRVFRNVDDELMKTINSISSEIIGVSLDIVRLAEAELDCNLNPNLYLMLADHLQYAAERFADGVVLANPLAADIPLAYPVEYGVGKTGLGLIKQSIGIELPEVEACSIAIHIATAEGRGSTMSTGAREVNRTLEIVRDVMDIAQKKLLPKGETFDTSSHAYARFVTHLKFLIKRLEGGHTKPVDELPLLMDIARGYPKANACSKSIARYFKREHGWKLTDEERFYLLMYLIKLEKG